MSRMELCSPSYYSLIGETAGEMGDPDSHSDTVHNHSLLMNVRQPGEMPFPPGLFTKEQIHSICCLHAHALPLAVGILNRYECLLEFASDCDITQIAQDLEKVTCCHEVPVSVTCTTCSDRNTLVWRDKSIKGQGGS